MPETKTIREWLNELPEPYRSEAIENADPESLNLKKSTISQAVLGAFIWSNSKQGHYYWDSIHNDLCTPPTDK